MNAMQKTRFYLFMSLVARAVSKAFYIIGILSGIMGVDTFLFDRYLYDPGFLWAPAMIVLGAWALAQCDTLLVKQYGARA